ncbi:uncharacterized histidine-rich protein DDB_G0274557-like isoform X2 [Hyposmocoma kahamanoa]|uniref:uncharacterized histidine-rich protein DDB_G0274557-like isoform X2 n=1 Tax=Hyposmocoma kahamanoa TaxID=1477025 RepID=UPI000E6D5ADB|nr:uncharacterized histidine-rich protein DDB_G0274557-like isoform X2 [Hyposmocoma kahamanoa]
MDCRAVLLFGLAVLFVLVVTQVDGKKVVIHVPYKVKKIKHIHTVYKTVHHHHVDHAPLEEHEHFHHMHIHDEPPAGQHSHPVPGIGIPEFLPDVPDVPMEIPDVPHDISVLPNRHIIPLYRRKN